MQNALNEENIPMHKELIAIDLFNKSPLCYGIVQMFITVNTAVSPPGLPVQRHFTS
jgi:hypothetical protein